MIFLANRDITTMFARSAGITNPGTLRKIPPLPVCFDTSKHAEEVYLDMMESILPSYRQMLQVTQDTCAECGGCGGDCDSDELDVE